ncbi:MAG: hypothetical protein HOQ18_16580 [Dermatophilaceae bacterium]|nr:hypothetical protein [Dermatophilaceae bacterium]
MRRAHAAPAAAAVLPVAVALGLTAVLGACTAGKPDVELSQVAGSAVTGTPVPTQTVTVTEIDTRTVTATTTVVQSTTTTVVATPTVTVTALPRPSLTTSTVFNRAIALADYANLVNDVRVLDRIPLLGNAAAVQLDAMTQHLERLGANGPPPGLDAPSYYGRLLSLGLFAHAGADEAAAGSPVATSRYAVVRQETGVLLSIVNGALSTTFALPPPVPRATTATP